VLISECWWTGWIPPVNIIGVLRVVTNVDDTGVWRLVPTGVGMDLVFQPRIGTECPVTGWMLNQGKKASVGQASNLHIEICVV